MPKDIAIIYQLEKVDQAGQVSDLFEGQIAHVAHMLSYEVNMDGELVLPDGRLAGLQVTAYIRDPDEVNRAVAKALTNDPA